MNKIIKPGGTQDNSPDRKPGSDLNAAEDKSKHQHEEEEEVCFFSLKESWTLQLLQLSADVLVR